MQKSIPTVQKTLPSTIITLKVFILHWITMLLCTYTTFTDLPCPAGGCSPGSSAWQKQSIDFSFSRLRCCSKFIIILLFCFHVFEGRDMGNIEIRDLISFLFSFLCRLLASCLPWLPSIPKLI